MEEKRYKTNARGSAEILSHDICNVFTFGYETKTITLLQKALRNKVFEITPSESYYIPGVRVF